MVHDETERIAYEQLLMEKEKTEKALKETAHFLWELTGRHISTGGRELFDWARMDREHAWSVALFTALAQHRRASAAGLPAAGLQKQAAGAFRCGAW